MRMVEPAAMRREEEPSPGSQDSVRFTKIAGSVPDMLEHLERRDHAEGAVARLKHAVLADRHLVARIDVRPHIARSGAPEPALVRARAAAEVEHTQLAQLQVAM